MDTSCNWQMNRARTSLRRPPAYQPRRPCSVSACTGSAPSLAASRRIASTASSNAAGWLGANPSRQPSRYSRRSLESTSPAAGVAVNRSPNSRTSPGARAVRTRRARRSPPPPPGSRARAARPSRPKVGRGPWRAAGRAARRGATRRRGPAPRIGRGRAGADRDRPCAPHATRPDEPLPVHGGSTPGPVPSTTTIGVSSSAVIISESSKWIERKHKLR